MDVFALHTRPDDKDVASCLRYLRRMAEITQDLIRLLDPCMGSGHFLVFALPLLARLRMKEEKLSAQEAVIAVLRDNIHGLELDERCTQIAAFNARINVLETGGSSSPSDASLGMFWPCT